MFELKIFWAILCILIPTLSKHVQCFLFVCFLFQAGIPDPPNMSEELIKIKAKERHFLEQLLDGKNLENYNIPVPIKAELRRYQQVSYYSRCFTFLDTQIFFFKCEAAFFRLKVEEATNKIL